MTSTTGGGGTMGDPELMHYRVKRGSETIFLLVEPSDTFGKLRSKVSTIVGKSLGEVRLIGPDKKTVLEDDTLVSDKMIEDDSILYLVYAKGKEFEKPFVSDSTEDRAGSANS
eukprot:gb/GECG01009518.1/.p1 GENE.gb/GECG01009518.1/~~gb/GECG01009518.1/.p1  ORF type:complete len:113 (+),score=10.22 gb/GECG01009518.1/:1-339(+)